MTHQLVVVGLGYVGLPLAEAAAAAGLRTTGLDTEQSVVDALNSGSSHVDDVSDEAVESMIAHGFSATTDEHVIADADTIVICVPTPLDESHAPELTAVMSASETISRNLQAGQLVVLESTTYPGTTEDVVLPILETSGLSAGTDFRLAYSPERIDPGNPTYGIANTPKVVGGIDERSTATAAEFYGKFIDEVHTTTGTREAELAKLLENTYRHVNIALVNEMAVFCHDLGVDLWASIEAAKTKPFGFHAFYPGPGVGGHCIPIDPNYLSYKVRSLGYPFRFVELAQEISDRMPAYVAGRIASMLNAARKPVNGSRVLLLGVTYKKDIGDERESPSKPVARRLLSLGANLAYADPYVGGWSVDDTSIERVEQVTDEWSEYDAIVLLQDHSSFDFDALMSLDVPILDTRGVLDKARVERL